MLTLAGDRVCAMTRFDDSVLPSFGLPATLPGRWRSNGRNRAADRGDQGAALAP